MYIFDVFKEITLFSLSVLFYFLTAVFFHNWSFFKSCQIVVISLSTAGNAPSAMSID